MLQSILDPRSQRFALDKIWRSLNPTRYLLGAIFVLESMRAHTHTHRIAKKNRMTTEHLLFLVPIENLGVQIVGSRIRDCLIPSCHSSGF